MSSSGSAPSPVICPLAKLGRLSPSAVRLSYTTATSSPLGTRRGFKSTSSESLDYKSSQSDYLSYITCNSVGQNANTSATAYSPVCRYQEAAAAEYPTTFHFYCAATTAAAEKPEENGFFQTSMRCSSPDRASPYLDQGWCEFIRCV